MLYNFICTLCTKYIYFYCYFIVPSLIVYRNGSVQNSSFDIWFWHFHQYHIWLIHYLVYLIKSKFFCYCKIQLYVNVRVLYSFWINHRILFTIVLSSKRAAALSFSPLFVSEQITLCISIIQIQFVFQRYMKSVHFQIWIYYRHSSKSVQIQFVCLELKNWVRFWSKILKELDILSK